MARGIEGNEIGEPKAKKPGSSSTEKPASKQQSIASFFQKRQGPSPSAVTPAKRASDALDTNDASKSSRSDANITPGSSSAPTSSIPQTAFRGSQQSSIDDGRDKENGMDTLDRRLWLQTDQLIETPGTSYSSPSRKSKKQVNYAESEDEDDEDGVFKPLSGNGRASKRRRISVKEDSDDDFGFDAATQAAMESDDGMLASHCVKDLLTSLPQSLVAFSQRQDCQLPHRVRKLTDNQISNTLLFLMTWKTMRNQ